MRSKVAAFVVPDLVLQRIPLWQFIQLLAGQ